MSNAQILLAVDDVLEGQKISHWLNSWGYHALIFTMWDERGSFHFENIKPDIILMDILFKGHTNAMNMLEKIKQDLDIPLVYLTSDFFDYHGESPILNNSYNFLARPLDPRLLHSTLEIALYKRHMEHSLKDTEQRYRLLIENSDDPIAMISYSGNFLLVNQSASKFFGMKQGDFSEKSIWDMFPRKYANMHMKNIRAVIETGKGRIIESKTIIQGKELWFSTNLQPITINGERAVQLIARDITTQKGMAKTLRKSEEKFRTLAQTAVDAIIITDHLDRIVFCNSSMERIFEYENENVVGQYIDLLIPQRHTEQFQNKIDRYLHKNDVGNVFEFYGLRRDGSEFPIEISLNTWEAADEIYTTFIIRDITLRKLNEFKFKMREEIFQLMAKNIEEVFWNIDPLNGQILYMSPSYHKIWGHSVDNLYQNPRSWLDSIHYEDRDKFVAYIFGKPESDQNMKGIQCRVIRPDGKVRWVNVRAFPVINQNKEIYRIIGLAKDITTIKKIEMESKELKLSRDF